MNLLKQTALILGLASLSLGSWNLYRNRSHRISILFSIFCFTVSVWALSFVSHVTLVGRLSHDIHLFCNVFISPLAIMLLSRLLLKKESRFAKVLQGISIVGAVYLGAVIGFSIPRGEVISRLIDFWPALILIEFLYIMVQDLVFEGSINTDYISQSKKIIFYLGLGISLSFCSFDRIPFLGYTIPAIGNLLFTVYLLFSSQIIVPQKVLGVEALVTRFFATVILALIITGFFALLYDYISETFPLFLLNSFLISFAVLMLWNPLVTFFRYLARRMGTRESHRRLRRWNNLRLSISVSADLESLKRTVTHFFRDFFSAERVELVLDPASLKVPGPIISYFEEWSSRNVAPLLNRELISRERDQVLTAERREALEGLLQFLDNLQMDIVFPIFHSRRIVGLLNLKIDERMDSWNLDLSQHAEMGATLNELGPNLWRLTQLETEKEKDRLVLMGEMAAGLAHEVRNPLGSIRGAVDLLGDSSKDEPWVKIIREEVSRLNRLVSQFLDFAQDPKDQSEEIRLEQLVKTVIANLKVNLSIPISLVFSTQTSIVVKVVPDHLQQILINLVQNSVKALEGSKNPELQIRVFDSGFQVSDNGIGMNEETLKKVFTPFFTSFRDGTGLGLAICKRLVHFNGGKISIESIAGQGSKVTVELPKAGNSN